MSEKHPEERESSPATLGERGGEYLDRLWEELYLRSDTAEEWAANLAELVHHARHLRPEDHAELAKYIRTPFKRQRGRPANNTRRREIWNKYHSGSALSGAPAIPRHQAIAEIANDYGVCHEAAEKAYDQARKGPHPDFED